MTRRFEQLSLWGEALLSDPVTGPRGRGLRALSDYLSIHPEVEDRYRAKVWRSGRDGECQIWTGALNGRTGHAKVHIGYVDGRAWVDYGHRIAWVLSGGERDDDLYIRHTCDEAPCQNPDHLIAGSAADNSHDWAARRVDIRGPLGDARGQFGRARALQDAIARTRHEGRDAQRAAVRRAADLGVGSSQLFLEGKG